MHVYLIQEGKDGPVKVGMANKPEKRLSELQVGNPTELFLVEVIELNDREKAKNLEDDVYRRCYKWHIRGEWYEKEIIEKIKELETIEYDPNYHDQFKKIPVGYKIPAWMDEAIKRLAAYHETTQNEIIETAIMDRYKLLPPKD